MCAEQFGELRSRYEEIEATGLSVIGLALEEEARADTVKFVPSMGGAPPFPLLADVGREQTERYEQTTAYLVDEDGIVRQVFPMQTYARGELAAILRESERVLQEAQD